MLSGRAIARSAQSSGVSMHPRTNWTSGVSTSSQRLTSRQARRFGTSIRTSGLKSGGFSALRSRHAVAAPLALGGVMGARHLSLWGYGKKKEPQAEEAASSTDAVRPVDPTNDNPVPTPPTEPAVSTTDIDMSKISEIVKGEDILAMPENIGYLHAMGLEYGMGPTSIMQWALEHIHVWSGLGWGASIMVTAVLLRILMFYPQVQSLRFNAVMQKLRKDPRSKEAMKLVQQGLQERDMEMRQRGQYLNKMLKEQYGASNLGMLWSFGQIPFTFGLFRIVSGMTHIPVPALESAGFLWFEDLTVTDPYFILPAVGTALMIGALAINAKHTPESQKKMLKTMTYVFGVVGFIGTTFLSAAVNLMTVALGGATLITAIILNNGAVRRLVGLPAHQETPPATITKATYEAPRAADGGLRERLNSNLNDMKKGLSDQLTNYTGTYSGTDEEKAERKRKDLMRKLEDTRKQQERDEFEKKYKSKR